MTEAPITFTDEAVQQILAGRKTQARFPVMPQPPGPGYVCEKTPKYRHDNPNAGRSSGHRWAFNREAGGFWGVNFDCPWGMAGGTLWVQEAWGSLRLDGRNESVPVIRSVWADAVVEEPSDLVWHPADEMPRHASRISLDLVDVRVDQLQDISEDDARAEGGILVIRHVDITSVQVTPEGSMISGHGAPSWVTQFREGWAASYPDYPWEFNPWSWVLDFKLKG